MKRKAREEEAEQGRFNHGVKWVRGKMIGKGGFGSVFLATLRKPKSRFSCFPQVMAVKSAEVSASGSLQKEKEVLDNVQDCPNVIKCFGEEITTGQKGEMIFNLLLEFASGGTLADEIKKSAGKGLPESDVKRYTLSILKGLNHIHQLGFVHCDLKPDNVLLVSKPNSTLSAKIGDFGLAKRIRPSKKRNLDPYLRGTAMYMAPEVVASHKQDHSSDIWALGCIVLEMLTGSPPWQSSTDSNTDDLLRLISNPINLPTIPSEISKEGKQFLKGCFVRNPMFRLTSEMLLCHSFLDGIGEDEDLEEESESSMTEDDDEDDDDEEDELSDCFSEDWGSISGDYLSSSSWSEAGDFEGSEVPNDESGAENAEVGSQEMARISCIDPAVCSKKGGGSATGQRQ